MLSKKESSSSKGGKVDIRLQSLEIEFRGYKLDAKASLEKSGIKMWGDFDGRDFKMTLRPNGYVWFELNHKRFNHPVDSSSSAEFRHLLEHTRADHDEAKKLFYGVWSAYNGRVTESAMVTKKVPYNTIGHFNFYLDSTAKFGEGILSSQVIISGHKAEGSALARIKAPFAHLYRKLG